MPFELTMDDMNRLIDGLGDGGMTLTDGGRGLWVESSLSPVRMDWTTPNGICIVVEVDYYDEHGSSPFDVWVSKEVDLDDEPAQQAATKVRSTTDIAHPKLRAEVEWAFGLLKRTLDGTLPNENASARDNAALEQMLDEL